MAANCARAPSLEVSGGDVYQWDQGRKLWVPSGFKQVHFAHDPMGAKPAQVVMVKHGYAHIPNGMLQEPDPIYAYATDGKRTYIDLKIPVRPRPMPSDYVYRKDEIVGLEQVHEWIKEELAKYGSYSNLTDKPSINGHELDGDLTTEELGIEGNSEPIPSDRIKSIFGKE